MKKIQIALVSKETLPVYYIINEFMPDTVYLLGTEQTRGEMADIERVARLHGVECVRRTVPADDMRLCLRACEQIHAENGDDGEYCYNLTCGTKLMAFAALICAQSHHAKMVYTDTTKYVDFDTMANNPITRFLDTETIIALQGQRIKEKTVYAHNTECLECACDIRDFIRQHRKTYGVLANHYRSFQQLPREYDNQRGVRYERSANGEIRIEENDVEVFWSDYRYAFDMLFKGQWWETLVADAVKQWAGAEHDVWTNVVFNPAQKLYSENAKNEIDVLVNIDNVLLFVECKSGMFDQNNIYKLKSVRETYGSYKSKGVIIAFSRDNIKDGFEEKAKESNIHIIVPNRDLSNLPSLLDKIIKSQNA